MIRHASFSDSDMITNIYNYYIRNTIITFEEQEVSSDEISNRMDTIFPESLPWLVAEESGKIVGYAYAAKWKIRSAYRFSVESTVYVEPNNFRRPCFHLYWMNGDSGTRNETVDS